LHGSLHTRLERTAREHGADVFGVADLAPAIDVISRQGGTQLREFPTGISIGIRLADSVVNELHKHDDPKSILPYETEYFSVNSHLDTIGALLANAIREEGYLAEAIPASQMIDPHSLTGLISHKLVANLAGLGWIGKSCLLITPDYGPRVRFASVLTNAPLKTSSRINTGCSECDECVKICPVTAFTGAPFNPLEPREVRFNAHLCNDYMEQRAGPLGKEGLCGLCVYVCPVP